MSDARGIWDDATQTWVSDDDAAEVWAWLRARTRRRPLKGLAIDHIDGDPRNNDLANLRVVDIRANVGRDR